MAMTSPGLFGQLRAMLSGEISAQTLEAYRRAGLAVHELHADTDRRMEELKAAGSTTWSTTTATQAERAFTWNAFVLQTLGDEFLDADYRLEPSTSGFVPPVTSQQILSFYSGVAGWLSLARQAQSNPDYVPDVDLPAELPPWSEVEPCPRSHMEGMLAATRILRTHAEAEMAGVEETAPPPEHERALRVLRERFAEANAKADYAERLWATRPPAELHEQIEIRAKEALATYFELGQLAAMPTLADPERRKARDAERRKAGDAEAGAAAGRKSGTRRRTRKRPDDDPWVLTDPGTLAQWRRDPAAREAIEYMWANDPDPARTLEIQREIDDAIDGGTVDYATNAFGGPVGPYFCCPWAPVYVAKRAITIGGTRLRPLQQFTFDVSAEEIPEGGEFKREILIGDFTPTDRIDYCDPRRGGHDDD